MLIVSAISSEIVALFLPLHVKQNVDFHLVIVFIVMLTAFWWGMRRVDV